MDKLKPSLLIAMPVLKDSYFEKSVILLCDYTLDNAFGVVINNPSNMQLKNSMLAENSELFFEEPFLLGGPVQPEAIWCVHSSEFIGDTSIQLNDDLILTSTIEVIERISKGQSPKNYLIGCGYAGWGENQLDTEIEEGAWWMIDLDTNITLNTPYEERWEKSIKSVGIDPDNDQFLNPIKV